MNKTIGTVLEAIDAADRALTASLGEKANDLTILEAYQLGRHVFSMRQKLADTGRKIAQDFMPVSGITFRPDPRD